MISLVHLEGGVARFEPLSMQDTLFWYQEGGHPFHPHPVFSPDDRFVFYNSDRTGTTDIYRVAASA